MKTSGLQRVAGTMALCLAALSAPGLALAAPPGASSPHPTPDPRLREMVYDPGSVVTVPVKRGVVTLVQLGSDEAIEEVAAGLGSDCAKPDASWCITAQAGGRTLFVKPKSAAAVPNSLAVVTDRRTHVFHFVVLDDHDPKPPLYRIQIHAPVPVASSQLPEPAVPPAFLPVPSPLSPQALVAERLQAKAQVRNSQYSLAEGAASNDIVPTLVFDDGRFTYLAFPGNRELPAVFEVLADGTESMVNARMEDDLLVIDRVARRFTLRAGSAVVGIWNEAFDLNGAPAQAGTTVPGVVRSLRSDRASIRASSEQEVHRD